MSFWSLEDVTDIATSSIDQLLNKDECTFDMLFDDPHYLLELKSNEDLINFVIDKKHIDQCINYLCTDSTNKGGMAAQTFASDVEIIQTTIITNTNYLNKLFTTFITETNPLILTNLVTVFTAFHKHSTFKELLKENNDMINHLFKSIQNPISCDYLIFLITSSLLKEKVMTKLIDMLTSLQHISEIELIISQIIDWTSSNTNDLFKEFISSTLLEKFFETLISTNYENQTSILHIISILLPLDKNIDYDQTKLLNSLTNTIQSLQSIIDKKVTFSICYYIHIIQYCIQNKTSFITEFKQLDIMEKILNLYCDPLNLSSIMRHYVNDIFTYLIKTDISYVIHILTTLNLPNKLIEMDKQISIDHYKYDLYIFEYTLMLKLFKITSTLQGFESFNNYITTFVSLREVNKSTYFIKEITLLTNPQKSMKNFVVDDDLDNSNNNVVTGEPQTNSTFDFNDTSFGDFQFNEQNTISSSKTEEQSTTKQTTFDFGSFSFDSSDFGDFN
ncbi:Serine/threonine-protein phosphatase 4 regulatory subunit 3-like central domain-containing protein [Entamoeba marina]